jgi:hypothetical protein
MQLLRGYTRKNVMPQDLSPFAFFWQKRRLAYCVNDRMSGSQNVGSSVGFAIWNEPSSDNEGGCWFGPRDFGRDSPPALREALILKGLRQMG